MKTIEEMTAVMKAFQDGKEIERRAYDDVRWYSVEAPMWDWCENDYRIKQEPKYRPYANAEECFADIRKHGSWVKNTVGQYINIIAVGESAISYASDKCFPYEHMYRHWVWADDGTPCGVKENENL